MISFDFNYVIEIFPVILKASRITLSIALFASIISFVLAIIMAIVRYYNINILSTVVKVYVSFFRGTPIITQLFLIYFGIFTLNETLSSIPTINVVILSLSLNVSAYMCETIRASFKSVDRGQIEACISLGMNNIQTMRKIIFPQAIKIAMPSLFNSFIDLIKGTSIAFIIGVPEMMAIASYEGSKTYKYFEIYFTIAVIYWCLSGILGVFQKKLEKGIDED